MRDFVAYAQFAAIWDRFSPETPFGRAAKEALTVSADRPLLETAWDETEGALALLDALEGDRVRLSRIQHHLKRLPRFPEESKAIYDEVEIFQFKKFLHNFHALAELLEATTRSQFGLAFESEALAQLLDQGRQSAESFYVADAYSATLRDLRAEIREVDQAIQAQREHRAREIQTRWGFDFDSRAFLLVPRERVGDPDAAADCLLVEPYDAHLYAVRPRGTAEELVLQDRRSGLLSRERAAEDEVLEMLSHAIREELGRFARYREALTRFDLALARARLARELDLVRPELGNPVIQIEGGRFLPCAETCARLGTEYVPLDAAFGAKATVIFGSNMGGKTMVLKTLAFLQLCAQMGLFVPARTFRTRLFQHFHYLGEGRSAQAAQGLSGFGFEIRGYVEASQDFQEPTLVLFDEFARTTNSLEAEAILSAVLEAVVASPGAVALFSTHFRGVRRLAGVDYRRMKGLNREGLALDSLSGAALEARIRLIDQHMEYHLVPDAGDRLPSDAITVAGLLGLDAALARRAAAFFTQET